MSLMQYFAYAHLPEHLQQVSEPIGKLAQRMEHALSANPEKEVGMRKLLEAKDCFVRAALASPAPKLPAYQQRVVDEVAELDDRLNKLQTFLRRDPPVPMPGEALALLVKQAALMQELSDVLHRRISQFPKEGQ